MGQIESALGHHFDQIPEAQVVAEVPAYAQDDHLTIEVPPCKQLLKAAQLATAPQLPERPMYPMGPWLFAPDPLSSILGRHIHFDSRCIGGTPSAGTMGSLTKLDRGAEVCQTARK
jgi:hypothetical protein